MMKLKVRALKKADILLTVLLVYQIDYW